jgi:uroporphyrinogen-III decarboxylase
VEKGIAGNYGEFQYWGDIEASVKLAKERGRVCIDLDIDRQYLLLFGTAQEIEDHVRNSIIRLNSKEGGLMLTAGIYPDVPLENIDALCSAVERHMNLCWT